MKRILNASFIMVMMILTACSKDNDSSSQPGEQTKLVDTINFVAVQAYKFGAGYDTSGNYIARYLFRKHSPSITRYNFADVSITNASGYIATKSDAEAKYTIKYVGGADFTVYQSSKDNPVHTGTFEYLYLNEALLGKPLFEVYDIKTNKVVKKLICASDSAVVEFSYSVWDNPNITPKQNGDALNYYMNVKQTDKIKYY